MKGRKYDDADSDNEGEAAAMTTQGEAQTNTGLILREEIEDGELVIELDSHKAVAPSRDGWKPIWYANQPSGSKIFTYRKDMGS